VTKLTWKTEEVPLCSLIPTGYNPRTLTKKEYADLYSSLEKFGLVEIPVINKDGVVLAGHKRLRIMGELGSDWDDMIDVRVPNRLLTKQEADEYLIRSNKNTGDWDYDKLANCFEVDDLLEWGFKKHELFGFDEEESKEMDDEVVDGKDEKDDEVVDGTKHPYIKVTCGDYNLYDVLSSLAM